MAWPLSQLAKDLRHDGRFVLDSGMVAESIQPRLRKTGERWASGTEGWFGVGPNANLSAHGYLSA